VTGGGARFRVRIFSDKALKNDPNCGRTRSLG
jgi:hypothetical protein